jgi:Mor family transcriptional regulator
MRYKNARDVFPKDILALIQQYTDGEYVYIPRKTENRRIWGENTGSKDDTRIRNEEIFLKYTNGYTVTELASEYFLSEKSIQRIITSGKKNIKTT